jgi:hypothetical protein
LARSRRRNYRAGALEWVAYHRRKRKDRAATAWVILLFTAPIWLLIFMSIESGCFPRGVRPARGYHQGPRGPIVGLTSKKWTRLQAKWHGNCAYCGTPTANPHREHDRPLMRGGVHDLSNIVPACGYCNQQKGTRTGAEYMEWRRRRSLPVNPDWIRLISRVSQKRRPTAGSGVPPESD